MKKIIIFTSSIVIFISILLFKPTKISADEIQSINSLITRGQNIIDNSGSDAYVWATDVLNFIDNYKETIVYTYIKNYCNSAKSNTLSYDNSKNKILGALLYLKSCMDNTLATEPTQLISEGATISNNSSPEAYKWLFNIIFIAEKNTESSVYKNLINCCNSGKSNTLSYDNIKSKIIADLTVLDKEIVISSNLIDIVIVKSPNKTVYTEGDLFDPTGVEINAILRNTYKNGEAKSVTQKITNYDVNTKTKLNTNDTQWIFNYTYNGTTKSAIQYISVTKYIPELISTTLDSISVASKPKKTTYLIGETFNSKGLKVNAKYKSIWSDGSITYTTAKSVKFSVDKETPLSKDDKKWVISYKDNGISVKTSVKIKVKSADPTINYSKKTLTPGDTLQLRVFGTEKYVMWNSDKSDIIKLTDKGLVEAISEGTAKVSATIGSGKNNIKLTCTIKIKPKVSADKTILFMENDEYETITVTANKKNTTYNVYSDSDRIKVVDEGKGVYDIVPNKDSYYGSRDERFNVTIVIATYNSNGTEFVEQEIPVFVYSSNETKTITCSLYSNGFYFDGNRAVEYDESVLSQFKKYAKKSEYKYSRLEIEITKENFEKVLRKAFSSNKAKLNSYHRGIY